MNKKLNPNAAINKARWLAKPGNREKVNALTRKWRAKYPEKARRAVDAWEKRNAPRVKELITNWKLRNPEKITGFARSSYHRRSLCVRARLLGVLFSAVIFADRRARGRCEICGGLPKINARNTGRLCIDHDHSKKKVRGMLCNACNTAIGMARDNPTLLRKMADYLEAFENGTTTQCIA